MILDLLLLHLASVSRFFIPLSTQHKVQGLFLAHFTDSALTDAMEFQNRKQWSSLVGQQVKESGVVTAVAVAWV